jgi:hypothetical protein
MELVIGAIASLFVEGLKRKYGTDGWATRAILMAMVLTGATAYYFLVQTGYWEIVAKVLVTAGAFYAFVIQYFK